MTYEKQVLLLMCALRIAAQGDAGHNKPALLHFFEMTAPMAVYHASPTLASNRITKMQGRFSRTSFCCAGGSAHITYRNSVKQVM